MSEPVVVRGDARRLPLPDASVDLVVTSPPFLNLRSYTDGGQHYDGQIGVGIREHFLGELWTVTAECARVLKPAGSMFVELGDSYTSKSLNLTPARYAIGCVDRLGLLVRAEIVWSRPNGLPESVTDRVRRSHSLWVHLTKAPRYYAAVDEIREPHAGQFLSSGARNARYKHPGGVLPGERINGDSTPTPDRWGGKETSDRNALGKLPGSVWEVATEPLKVPERLGVDHFAAFPSEWPRRLILGWSPPGICTVCGEGRHPVMTQTVNVPLKPNAMHAAQFERLGQRPRGTQSLTNGVAASDIDRRITGYACACTPYTDHPGTGESAGVGQIGRADNPGRYPNTGEGWEPSPSGKGGLGDRPKVGPWREYYFDRWTPPPTRPAVVLDPFGGTGTVAHVAVALGRIGVTVDLSADYCRVAAAPELYHQRRRKVLGLDKPTVAVVPEGQLGFDWEGASA